MSLTAAECRARAEQLEGYADQCRRVGFIQGPEGAEDAEAAARDWRETAERIDLGLAGEPR